MEGVRRKSGRGEKKKWKIEEWSERIIEEGKETRVKRKLVEEKRSQGKGILRRERVKNKR